VIENPADARRIKDEWAVVKKFCTSSHRQAMVGAGIFINETPPDSFYNLALLLAYGVLDQTLNVLIGEGVFTCKSWMLGAKMSASKTALTWTDFAAVDAGKDRRNALAHNGVVASKADCLATVAVVEAELHAWGVI
jgi:hypothetical protein